MAVSIEKECWLGYRWSKHGFADRLSKDALSDVLVLGLQASRQSNGEQALSQRVARIGSTGIANAITPDGPLVSMWSVRGAPHAHRASQLDMIRDALAPLSSDEGGSRFVDAVHEVADAMSKIVTSKTAKGELSREVADSIPASLVQYCEGCQARHVSDRLSRAAGPSTATGRSTGRGSTCQAPSWTPYRTPSRPTVLHRCHITHAQQDGHVAACCNR